MPAAMTVSVLVARYAPGELHGEPGRDLAAVNRSLLSRSRDGFTTCRVLRADPDGSVAPGQCRHSPPYCDGEELVIESGLPLGLLAQSTYPEVQFELRPGAQLTLLTDGVVEARSASGDLFGFARTQAWSCKSAEQIVEAARAFGQEDDITVVTVALAEGTAVATLSGDLTGEKPEVPGE